VCVFFWPEIGSMPTIGVGHCLEFVGTARVTLLNAGGEET
jgi:hypothetical protein